MSEKRKLADLITMRLPRKEIKRVAEIPKRRSSIFWAFLPPGISTCAQAASLIGSDDPPTILDAVAFGYRNVNEPHHAANVRSTLRVRIDFCRSDHCVGVAAHLTVDQYQNLRRLYDPDQWQLDASEFLIYREGGRFNVDGYVFVSSHSWFTQHLQAPQEQQSSESH